ncbi:MAG: D-glycero-beta-D-manno-heptose 1-phosphate adenylyltransferase [Ignavibacteria bacterium]|jgi:rfaE bifunctional protein nucleotidyltransferase chain/domain|nr:D-glycero-beta-D-manno-heptose 1-phosphate adenylyltransferase [Ignavibacteria bacterium]MBK9228894.1 D-glycero-beta-D-manno-heptose 1-phosphate adenylyltransferase [Ignavibacteria bacterium]
MIIEVKDIKKTTEEFKNNGKKIVFTNGCFDILHRGHAEYLEQAKSLGDLLVVGVNSDESVKRLKGDDRPINNESDRAFMLDKLKPVDLVTIFTEDTPFNLISEVIPDVLVKGGDWKEEDIVGSDVVKGHGGKVISLKFVDSYSTTSIIDRMSKDKQK